jgi:hypothetical protein
MDNVVISTAEVVTNIVFTVAHAAVFVASLLVGWWYMSRKNNKKEDLKASITAKYKLDVEEDRQAYKDEVKVEFGQSRNTLLLRKEALDKNGPSAASSDVATMSIRGLLDLDRLTRAHNVVTCFVVAVLLFVLHYAISIGKVLYLEVGVAGSPYTLRLGFYIALSVSAFLFVLLSTWISRVPIWAAIGAGISTGISVFLLAAAKWSIRSTYGLGVAFFILSAVLATLTPIVIALTGHIRKSRKGNKRKSKLPMGHLFFGLFSYLLIFVIHVIGTIFEIAVISDFAEYLLISIIVAVVFLITLIMFVVPIITKYASVKKYSVY